MAGSVKVVLKSVFDDKGIKQAQNQFNGLSKSFGGLAKVAAGAFAAIGGAAAFGTIVKGASNLEQQLGALRAVFGNQAADVQEFAEGMSGFGLSTAEAAQNAALLGSQLLGLGLSQGDAITKTKELQVLAADLAATYGGTTTEAVSALSAVFRGEYNQVERYGVALRKSDINARVAADGMAGLTGEALKQAEAQAGLSLIFEKTTVAQGQATREANTFAGQMAELEATFKNVRDEIGMEVLPVIVDLIKELKPLVIQLAPILSKLLQALSPIIVTLAQSIGPLFEAIQPLIDAFFLLIDAVAEILAEALPPFIRILDVLAPVVLQLVEAFLPLVMDLLPPLLELFEAMMPILMILVDYWTNFLIPIFEDLGEFISFTLIGVIEALTDGFKFLESVLGPLYAAIKPILDAVLQFMGIDPTELRKEMVVDVKVNDAELKKFEKVKFTGSGSTLDFLQGMGMGGVAPVVTTPTGGATGGGGGAKKTDTRKEIAQTLKESGEAVKKAQKGYRETVKKARDTYAKAVASINETYTAAVKQAEDARSKALTQAASDNASAIEQINSDTAKKLADIVATSINRLRDAFKGAVQVNVADLFASEDVGKSVDGLVKSLRDRLQGSQQLIANSAKLAAAGFSQTFIEQVVSSGVEAGNELAESILTATPDTQKELRSLFGELETTSETGMDGLSKAIYDGTGLATNELKKLYADTLTEQTVALNEQATAYTAQQVEIMTAFEQAMQDAGVTRDTALSEATKAYQDALKKAMEDFLLELDEIEKKFKEKLDKLKAQKSDIDKLQKQIDTAKGVVPVPQKIAPVIPNKNDKNNNTVINVNVKTDSTQSDAQVGKNIATVINKYTNTGGSVLTGRAAI